MGPKSLGGRSGCHMHSCDKQYCCSELYGTVGAYKLNSSACEHRTGTRIETCGTFFHASPVRFINVHKVPLPYKYNPSKHCLKESSLLFHSVNRYIVVNSTDSTVNTAILPE